LWVLLMLVGSPAIAELDVQMYVEVIVGGEAYVPTLKRTG